MMVMVPKWRITIERANAPALVLFMSDRFLANVLRKVAEIELEQEPCGITITAAEPRVGQMSSAGGDPRWAEG